MNKFDLDYIDSMRGIAILMVLAVHSTLMLMPIYDISLIFNIQNILISGKYGVSLFFIVSAYALFRSISIRKESSYKNYFIRRIFRIIPLYFIVLLVVYILTNIVHNYIPKLNQITFFDLMTHIFFVNGFFKEYFNSILLVEWTITVEMYFYLLLPLIIIYKTHTNKILMFSFVVAIILTIYGNELINSSLLYWFVTFTMGVWLYQNETNIKFYIVEYKYTIMFICIVLFVLFSYIETKFNYLIFSALLFVFFILNKFNHIKSFNNHFLKYIGKLSFSVYLIHMPIFGFIRILSIKMGGV